MSVIVVNDIELYYEQKGKGRPLLLLHGNGEDHHIFDVLARKLEQHYTVYAIDSRNHGKSSKTSEYSYRVMMQDIQHFIQKLALEQVSILGFSDGGIIALLLAIEQCSPLDKLILLGVNLQPTDLLPDILQSMRRKYEDSLDPLLKLMLEEPQIPLQSLRRVLQSVLLIYGADDIFRDEMVQNIAVTLPKSQLLVMDNHTHSSYIEQQAVIYEDVLSFLGYPSS